MDQLALTSAGGGGSVAIGGSITGGTADRVVFIATGPVLADSANLTFDGTSLTVGGSYVWLTKGSFASPSDGVNTLLNAAGTSYGRLQFGGTTSSFPAIKRNAAGIDFRLADDSTYCDISCASFTNTVDTNLASIFGVFGASGFVKVYSSGVLGFTSGAYNAALDGAFSRISAGVLGLGTGAQGSIAGTLSLSTIELGHASDTTLSRLSAGVLAVEGVVIPSISSTNTLTNKRITKRTGTTTSSATPTINTDNVDAYFITAQTEAITSFTTNLSGTPTEGQGLLISITGTAARAITWGTSFEASTVALPTTTVSTNRLDVAFIWNTVTSKWRCTGSA